VGSLPDPLPRDPGPLGVARTPLPESVTESPFLWPDGTVVEIQGFDEKTGTLAGARR